MARTSSRKAAAKAKEAIAKTSETRAAPKRKSVSKASEGSKPKAQKVDKSPSKTPKEEEHKESPPEPKQAPEPKEEDEVKSPDETRTKSEEEEENKPADTEEVKTEVGAEPTEGVTEKAEGKDQGESPKKESLESTVDLDKEAETAFQGEKDEPPSNVLEKGIIYFFFRGRVGVEDPESLEDVARSFIVLRPLPLDSTLAGGALADEHNCRLIMLPKKTFPTSPKQRYMAFVEKAKVDVKTIRDSFAGEDHETKTRGIRHTPAATPYAEGVYAITHSKSTSHLAYVLTIPQHATEIQTDFGLADRGSFIVASKNPKYPGPQYAQLPKGPDYPSELVDKMGDLRWVPIQPEYIDYPNAQIVIIGEKEELFGSAGMTEDEQKGPHGETAADELVMLEHADEIRTDKLDGAEAIFHDLGLSKDQFPSLESTW
ncbi:hypothetical protein KEM56_000629 [Ascosphaera pollenicola]|nr:hypothetical protein KEM56_000629 [Ascosphaera pollenicola]